MVPLDPKGVGHCGTWVGRKEFEVALRRGSGSAWPGYMSHTAQA